jgi:predicted PurR-regulated permease PerM
LDAERTPLRQINWTRILTILLVILASLALLYIAVSVLGRFANAVLLFVAGAMLAYVLTPIVNRFQIVLRLRWLAIVASYLLMVVLIAGIGALLFTPFIQQSQSLVDNLHTPSTSSLKPIRDVSSAAATAQSDLATDIGLSVAGTPPSYSNWLQLRSEVSTVLADVQYVKSNKICSRKPCTTGGDSNSLIARNVNPNETSFPSSYTAPVIAESQQLQAAFHSFWTAFKRDYDLGVQNGTLTADQAPPITKSERQALTSAEQHAKTLSTAAAKAASIFASSPILLLHVQSWLDDHGIKFDVHDKFGEVEKSISSQGSNLLNNAITILQTIGNLLLDTILILIIAFFLLLDGHRLIRGGLRACPAKYEEQIWYFVLSLDKVLGGYIRGTIFLAGLSGILGGAGAAVLGVPYPLLIGLTTFLLNMVPIIGPLAVYIPVVGISLFFTNVVTTLILFAWFVIFEQIVTNILGPRVIGHAVGIHPLETIAAVLIGFPLAGLLGAFLAVPVAAAFHILIRELYAYFVHGEALPTASVADLQKESEVRAPQGASPPKGARPAPILDPPPTR